MSAVTVTQLGCQVEFINIYEGTLDPSVGSGMEILLIMN